MEAEHLQLNDERGVFDMVSSKQRRNSKRVNRLLTGASLMLLVLGLAGGCDTLDPMRPTGDDTALTGEEVTKLINGNTFRGSLKANPLLMVFYKNGVLRGRLGHTGSDRGTWTVEGDVYCHHWVRYFSGIRRCYKWWRRSNDYLLENVDTNRARNLTGRIEPGKPPGF